MVHPSSTELARLQRIATEIRGAADEHGFRVGLAVDQHESFTESARPASELERSLISNAARRGAAECGMSFEIVAGGGLDIISFDSDRYRRYRLKRGRINSQGEYVFLCGTGSALLVQEPDALILEERWVLGFVTDPDHAIAKLMSARVIGWEGTGPVRLRIDSVIELGDAPPPRGFTSTEEELDEFFDEGDGDVGVARVN